MAKLLRQLLPMLTIMLIALAYSPESQARMHNCGPRDTERQCMVCNCFFESGGEPDKGKLAVNIVVLARMNSDFFRESTVCATVWKPAQFSWTQDRASNSLSTTTAAYRACEAQTDIALNYFRPVRNPTHYYAASGPNAIRPPRWSTASHFSVAQKVGHHVFLNDSREKMIRIPKSLTSLASMLSGASR